MTDAVSKFVVFVAVAAVLLVVFLLAIQIDTTLNGEWLLSGAGQWQWWNYFTSKHSLTMLYILHGWWWVVPPLVLAAIYTAIVTNWS